MTAWGPLWLCGRKSSNSLSRKDPLLRQPSYSANGYDCATFVGMSEVASRELRNDTAGVLRRVRDGEDVTITVSGRPVAVLTAVVPQRRRWLSKTELLSRLPRVQADPGLREDLHALAGDTTEELGAVR